MEILWLGQPPCADTGQTGGKAATLSRLANRYRIPPGFCIPAGVFARWAGSEAESRPSASVDLVAGVTVAYRALADQCEAANPPVAVRSSATDEDGTSASFAGQYESVLNVCGPEAVVEAVLRCWASARSERVASYRCRQTLPVGGARVAVLVQQLVVADVAAVAFSANPVTGDRGEVVISSSWGLGESIVGGSVTPDTYAVRKTDWTIARRSIAVKRRMAVLVPGGTHEVDVPASLQDAAALDDSQVMEVAQLAGSLEATTGSPVDIECAYQRRTLYLLQCRPVTTLR